VRARLASVKRALPIVPAAFLLVLFGRTLLRTVGEGDTANLQFIGRVLGITHAPGYPFYALATGLLTAWVPGAHLALAVNALSALFTVAASELLRRLLVGAGVARPVAIGLALLMAVEPLVWRDSLHAEVYTLHLLLSCATFYLFQRWVQTRRDRALLVACLVYALSFGNHMNTVTLLPAVVMLVWEVDRRALIRPRLVASVTAVVLLGASQYIYLVARSRAPAAYCESTVRDLDSFLFVVTGGPFRDIMFRLSIYELVTVRIPMFLRIGQDNLGLLFFPGLALVLVRGREPMDRFNRRAFFWATFWPLNYKINDVDSYFMVSLACVCIALGRSVAALKARVKAKRLVSWTAAAIFLLCAGRSVVTNFARLDESRDRAAETFATAVIAEVGSGAVVLSQSYAQSETLWYYTLGRKLQASRRLYMVHHVNPPEVFRYLRSGTPIFLPEQPGVMVPPGLRVLAIGPGNRRSMEQAGLQTNLLDSNSPGSEIYAVR
jgi:hypothetical protein